MGQNFEALLEKRSAHPPWSEIYEVVLYPGSVGFVLDNDLRTVFPPGVKFVLGLNILGNLGHTGHCQLDHVLVYPPCTVTYREIEEIVTLPKTAINMTRQPLVNDKG